MNQYILKTVSIENLLWKFIKNTICPVHPLNFLNACLTMVTITVHIQISRRIIRSMGKNWHVYFFGDPWMSKYMPSHAHFNFETSFLKRSIAAKTDTDRPPNVFFGYWIKLLIAASYSDWLTLCVFYSRNVRREPWVWGSMAKQPNEHFSATLKSVSNV